MEKTQIRKSKEGQAMEGSVAHGKEVRITELAMGNHWTAVKQESNMIRSIWSGCTVGGKIWRAVQE